MFDPPSRGVEFLFPASAPAPFSGSPFRKRHFYFPRVISLGIPGVHRYLLVKPNAIALHHILQKLPQVIRFEVRDESNSPIGWTRVPKRKKTSAMFSQSRLHGRDSPTTVQHIGTIQFPHTWTHSIAPPSGSRRYVFTSSRSTEIAWLSRTLGISGFIIDRNLPKSSPCFLIEFQFESETKPGGQA